MQYVLEALDSGKLVLQVRVAKSQLAASVGTGGVDLAIIGHRQSMRVPTGDFCDLVSRQCVYLPGLRGDLPLPPDAELAALRLTTPK